MGEIKDSVSVELLAVIDRVPDGWWWSVGSCSVSSDASIGPDMAYADPALLTAFDAGFHCDLPQPATVADALRDCITQAGVAIAPLASPSAEA